MSHTIRVSDSTYRAIVIATGRSGKSRSEVVDDTFAYVDAMSKKLNYERVTGHCLRCGSKRITK